jgi:hypothetical protein
MSEEIAVIQPKRLALIDASELSLVKTITNDKQLALILRKLFSM